MPNILAAGERIYLDSNELNATHSKTKNRALARVRSISNNFHSLVF